MNESMNERQDDRCSARAEKENAEANAEHRWEKYMHASRWPCENQMHVNNWEGEEEREKTEVKGREWERQKLELVVFLHFIRPWLWACIFSKWSTPELEVPDALRVLVLFSFTRVPSI